MGRLLSAKPTSEGCCEDKMGLEEVYPALSSLEERQVNKQIPLVTLTKLLRRVSFIQNVLVNGIALVPKKWIPVLYLKVNQLIGLLKNPKTESAFSFSLVLVFFSFPPLNWIFLFLPNFPWRGNPWDWSAVQFLVKMVHYELACFFLHLLPALYLMKFGFSNYPYQRKGKERSGQGFLFISFHLIPLLLLSIRVIVASKLSLLNWKSLWVGLACNYYITKVLKEIYNKTTRIWGSEMNGLV